MPTEFKLRAAISKSLFSEAYSQTAWRPVKPLVRVHSRKAVNKPLNTSCRSALYIVHPPQAALILRKIDLEHRPDFFCQLLMLMRKR